MEATGERFLPEKMQGEIKSEHLNRYYFVKNLIDISDKIVLDIASGEGYGSNLLAQSAKYVYGVDISEEAVNFAKVKYTAENLSFIKGSAFKIPLEDNSIDVVVSFETIEHHDKHDEMLKEINRVLKMNGILVLSSPNKSEYSDKTNFQNPYHVKELYTNELVDLVSKYFISVELYWQRYLKGSVILPIGNEININKIKEATDIIDSMYDVVVATNEPSLKKNSQIVLCFDQEDEVKKNYYDEYSSVLNSFAFKLGAFVLKPFYWIKSKLSVL